MASNKVSPYLIDAFKTPAFNPAKQWTAVIQTRYFSGSFDFETFDKARDYLVAQCAKGVISHDDGKTDQPQFRSTFIINRETFAVSSLADLHIAFERSNPWRRERNVCLTAAEHAVRARRVSAYLAKRAERRAPGETSMRQKSLIQTLNEAWPAHADAAREAYALFVGHCGENRPIRVPGMDTVYRLAIRIHCGRTVEEAAAREYVCRWSLALRSPVFGVPHTLGF